MQSSVLLCAALAGGLLSSGCRRVAQPGPERPNVVLLVIDTLRADRLPFYDYERETAPFLSELAERGVVFERAWSTSSWTAPSTASILTGLYPNQHGVTQGIRITRQLQEGADPTLELNRIPSELGTLPERMRELGYRTFGVADNPNICAAMGFADGFDRFSSSSDRGSDALNARLFDWLPEIERSEPWFVYLHYMDPHAPYLEREPYFDLSELPPIGPPGTPGQRIHAAYDSEIRALDDRVRAAFEALGAERDTVVLFLADHGEELRQRGTEQHGFKLFSELNRVPLVIVDPTRAAAVERVRADVSQVDVLPTLLEIAGLDAGVMERLAGQSLVPLYERASGGGVGARTVWSMRQRAEARGGDELRSFQSGRYKLIQRLDGDGALVWQHLFDLEQDWPETLDLAAQAPEPLAGLEASWSWFAENAELAVGLEGVELELSDDELESLRSLGYVGDE
jgi:arylsulfatase A-like enzyme